MIQKIVSFWILLRSDLCATEVLKYIILYAGYHLTAFFLKFAAFYQVYKM